MAKALCLPKMRNKLNHAYIGLIILSKHYKKKLNLKNTSKIWLTYYFTAALKRYR